MDLSATHDVLAPAGPQAAHIASLWHLTVGICALVFAGVLLALCIALWRAPRSNAHSVADLSGLRRAEPGPRRSVGTAVTASTLLLLAVLVASVFTDRALARLSLDDAVHVTITGHQWWWEVRYDDPDPTRIVQTANELHIPVGRPVVATLNADDVIHSFWAPNLTGKKDLIPGLTNTVAFRADRAGQFLGQCAEFCGLQHAQMALPVTAESTAQFATWKQAQLANAPDPAEPAAQHGRTVFLSSSCALCHAIQGTSAGARHAPDLTHMASRPMLAAGALPNTPEQLAGWIRDPQRAKPGTNMPPTNLAPADLDDLVRYLETLK